MQIRTGEGKLIVLGGCSALLALLGFRVRVLFGLSEPPGLQPLRNLFIAFGIAERVVYSTINKFSEVVCGPRATSTSLFVT